MLQLIVVRPFGSWVVGDLVKDAQEVEEILQSEHSEHVVRVITPGGE